MILFTKKEKNVSLTFEVDKMSKSYLVRENCGDVIKFLDQDYFNSCFFRLLQQKRKEKIDIIIKGTAICEDTKTNIIENQYKNIDNLIKKKGVANSGGIVSMLKNKGII